MGSSGGGRCCCCWCEKTRVAFRVLLNNENSAIAPQLGEVTATKTQRARETGVRVLWPAVGRDGGGTTTTTTARPPTRAFATSPRLASAIFAPPPRPQGRIGRVARAATCPARARKYNKRTKWTRVTPLSGRSTSRGGQNHPRSDERKGDYARLWGLFHYFIERNLRNLRK